MYITYQVMCMKNLKKIKCQLKL